MRSSDGSKQTAGYMTLINKVKDIFRKEEQDWKMVYLARSEGCPVAAAAWKFDFTGKVHCIIAGV